jgi:hypothetical protein
MLGIPYVGHIGPILLLALVITAVVMAVRRWVLPVVRRVTRPEQPQ